MREFLVFWRHSLRMVRYVRGIFAVLSLLLLGSALLLSHAEKIHFGEALYFTLITGLTVGYGDIIPASAFGRIVSVFVGVVGIVFFGLFVAVANRALALTAEELLPPKDRYPSR